MDQGSRQDNPDLIGQWQSHVRIGNDTNNNFGYDMNLSAIINYVISQ